MSATSGIQIVKTAGTRTQGRDSMMMTATIRRVGQAGGPVPVRVRNISAGGMMGEAKLALVLGEPVELFLKNIGEVLGTVAWSVEGRIGVAFDAPVDQLRVRRQVPVKTDRPAPRQPQSRRPGLHTT